MSRALCCEINQTEKDKSCIIILICGKIPKQKTTSSDTENRLVTTSGEGWGLREMGKLSFLCCLNKLNKIF